ncbi:MerR family transcriptional regulator [Enterobacter hormaechei]|nr:MerR family transcriptional regulator [Enterobacter hormaechei]
MAYYSIGEVAERCGINPLRCVPGSAVMDC